jgi:hypothetical protein
MNKNEKLSLFLLWLLVFSILFVGTQFNFTNKLLFGAYSTISLLYIGLKIKEELTKRK